MLVTVRLFARLREIAGDGELQVDVQGGATVADAWATLTSRHPELAAYTAIISCAVNEDYTRMTAALHENDEIAFLPPVSGG